MLSFFWSVFSHIRTEYRDLRSDSQYSDRLRENTGHKKLRIWSLFQYCKCQDRKTLYFKILFSVEINEHAEQKIFPSTPAMCTEKTHLLIQKRIWNPVKHQ